MALLAAMPAQAQDATWLFIPSTALYSTPTNWTPATVPTGTAFFGATSVAGRDGHGADGRRRMDVQCRRAWLTLLSLVLVAGVALTFNGAGIVINAGSATIINQGFGAVTFSGASTAGSATINNQGSGRPL